MLHDPPMGMVDLQINGYAGTDFNDPELTGESLHHACRCLQQDGADQVLATVITDELEAMTDQLDRLVRLRAEDPLVQSLISGFHIEGPFLSTEPGYRGAHPGQHLRPASVEVVKRLLNAADGLTRLVTLAPEVDPRMACIEYLADQHITVSAGHSNASTAELHAAIGAGLTMVTHLGNGCPLELPRHDNFIQRCLSLAQELWLCFIPDGVHIPFSVLRNYLTISGLERTILVTDAISAARMPPGSHRLGGRQIEVGEDQVARLPNGQLCGSTLTLPLLHTQAMQQLHLQPAELKQLTETNPRRAVRI